MPEEDLIRQLREAVGLSMDSEKPITPRQAWEDALSEARAVRKALEDAHRIQAWLLLAHGGRIEVPSRVLLEMPREDSLEFLSWNDPVKGVVVFVVQKKER